ncbi:MAG: hypothetical protein GY851_29050 [bacterium]|nr:hypothetical protein [bacterium]
MTGSDYVPRIRRTCSERFAIRESRSPWVKSWTGLGIAIIFGIIFAVVIFAAVGWSTLNP